MTDLVERSLTPGFATSPAARRLGPPRWRDLRLIVGVALILVAVVVGATVVTRAQHTTAVLAAAHPLPAGQVLTAADLTSVAVHLPASAQDDYWPALSRSALVGRRLLAPLGGGELVPRAALSAGSTQGPTRLVAVPVDPGRVPLLVAGDRVDVFATYRTDAAADGPGLTVAVVQGAVFDATGGSSADGELAVDLSVPVAQAGALVHASELGALDIVLEQPAGTHTGSLPAGPVTGPAGVSGAAGSGS